MAKSFLPAFMIYVSDDIPQFPSPEKAGMPEDLEWLKDDGWLVNSEVRYYLRLYRSQWHLSMVFIDLRNSMQFLCRYIDAYPSEKKALTYAQIMQRGIRKDARGTLKGRKDAFHICNN